MLQTDTADGKHAFELAMQYNPVDVEQDADPQLQSFAFTLDPSKFVQMTPGLHWLDAAKQNNPLVESHCAVPQVQSLAFSDEPSRIPHMGMILVEH